MQMDSDFYEALPPAHIRVLDLLPGDGDAPILVELHAVSVHGPGEYEALSYTWGDPKLGAKTIYCSGHEFAATANLFAALHRLRLSEQTRRLWIDAICINQGSITERTQQVQLMLEIYNGAKTVQIWIGSASDEDDIELLFRVANNRHDYVNEKKQMDAWPPAALAEFGRRVTPLILFSQNIDALNTVRLMATRIGDEDLRASVAITPQILTRLGVSNENHQLMLCVGMRAVPSGQFSDHEQPQLIFMPDFHSKHVQRTAERDWTSFEDFLREVMRPPEESLSDKGRSRVFAAVNRFCDRPYWQRAWIVQEVLVSKSANLLCGRHEVDFEVFCSVYGIDRRTNLDIKQFWFDDMRFWDAQENVALVHLMDKNILRKVLHGPTDRWEPLGRGYGTMSQLSYHRLYHGKRELTLARLLRVYERQKATNPRDHVFSLVGVLRHWSAQPKELKWCDDAIDYEKTIREVFFDAARHMIESYGQTGVDTGLPRPENILDLCCPFGGSTMGLPTWVPDWSAKHDDTVFDTRNRGEMRDLIPYVARCEGDSLFLSGHIVDTIAFVTVELDNTTGNDGMYSEVGMYKQIVEDMHLGQVYGSEDARSEAFWRTIIADNPIGSKPWTDLSDDFQELDEIIGWVLHAQENYQEIRRIWCDRLKYRTYAGPLLKQSHANEAGSASRIREAIGLASDGTLENLEGLLHQEADPEWVGLEARSELSKHRFLVTEKGYFGLCPPNVKAGDAVAILAGAVAPWFLRKVNQHYTLVAYGFVHGLMYKHDAFHQSGWTKDSVEMLELR